MLFCHVDSKAEGWKHSGLRQEKRLTGLPSVAFLDASGDVLVTVPYDRRTVAGFVESGERAREYVRLRAAAADGDRVSGAAFLLMQLEERQVDLPSARARRDALGTIADEGVRAAIDRRVVDLQILAELQQVPNTERHTLGPRFLTILREDPGFSAHVSRGFWYAILEWAEREGDAAAFRDGLTGLRDALAVTDPGKPWVDGLLARYRAVLARMEGDGTRRIPR